MEKAKLRIAQMLKLSKDVEIAPEEPGENGEPGVEAQFITVKPLSLTHILALLDRHRDTFVSLWAEGSKPKPEYGLFVASAEAMVNEIIVKATGRLDEYEDIAAMPGTVKITLLNDIFKLSVPNPKKLLETVNGIAAQVARLQKELRAAQPSASVTPPGN